MRIIVAGLVLVGALSLFAWGLKAGDLLISEEDATSVLRVSQGEEVPFALNSVDAESDGSLCVWDFGDGTPMVKEASPTHVYDTRSGKRIDLRQLLSQQITSVADYDVEIPGLELITSNQWGSDGMVHVQDASGKVINNFLSVSGVSRCQPVNWKGDGEEFLLTSADSLMGGMFDRKGQLAVSFPTDGHPVTYYMVQDLMGDTRDEIMVWDQSQLWIYTQDDNPRMGNTYAPAHIPLYNYSLHQMNRSLPGW